MIPPEADQGGPLISEKRGPTTEAMNEPPKLIDAARAVVKEWEKDYTVESMDELITAICLAPSDLEGEPVAMDWEKRHRDHLQFFTTVCETIADELDLEESWVEDLHPLDILEKHILRQLQYRRDLEAEGEPVAWKCIYCGTPPICCLHSQDLSSDAQRISLVHTRGRQRYSRSRPSRSRGRARGDVA